MITFCRKSIPYSYHHPPHLWVGQPAVVERYVEQVEDDHLPGVLKVPHPGKLDVDVKAGVELWKNLTI